MPPLHKYPKRQAGAAPRHGALPHTPRGLRPCDPEKPSYENVVFEGALSLPLVGPLMYMLFGWLSRPRVTFSFDPTETGLGYIVK